MESKTDSVTLNIEGSIAGSWLAELNKVWEQLAPSIGTRKLKVNLSGVTFLDLAASDRLREIHQQTGALFMGNSPLTSYFANEIMKPRKGSGEGAV